MVAIPRLLLVTDPSRSRLPLLDLICEAAAGGVDAIYMRAVDSGIAPTPDLILSLRERIEDHITLLVNDMELAAATGAGLHLRERDAFPTQYAQHSLIGRSVHSPEEAFRSTGMDYLLTGHVYPSASKPGKPPLGLDGLRAIVAAAPCPVLAIGGITTERVAEVVRAGAHGIAVIGAIAEADNPRAAAMALRSALDRALQHQNHEEQLRMSEKEKPNVSVLNGTATFELTVNGKLVSVPAGATVHDFLASKKMTDAMAIVERNGEIVPRSEYGSTTLTAGDWLEVVHAVGGG